jgi:coproporphyrinogen III oxidase-like Fe-S oxidoreductase
LDAEIRRAELVSLGLRTREGVESAVLDATKTRQLESGGLIFLAEGRATLTRQGRLLADEIAVELV